jgi:hypothetical protein
MPVGERTSLLQRAGLSRFDQKTQHFLVLLRDARPCGPFSACDTCLIPALAEALGYGRDRAFFRAAGLRLVGLAAVSDLPEPRGRAPAPAPLDASRLRALGEMVARWSTAGAWKTIRRLLNGEIDSMGVDIVDGSGACYSIRPDYLQSVMISALRANFSGISAARADIVICNVVLPFAAAVALLEADQALYAQAQQVYLAYPSLASNQVTRAMRRQLRLDCEPRRACQQQGLHYIYAQTCQEKRCEVCLVTRWGREP